MITFPNSKINLGLNILNKRADGFHDLETCMYPILWHDILEIIPAKSFSFIQTGRTVPGKTTHNLCVKAYELIKEYYSIPPIKIHLHKIIPMGAGLGGGSSNAAFTLKMLNQLFLLNISSERLKHYANLLGSDCPFFIDNLPAIASKKGEKLKLYELNLSKYYIIVIFTGMHISTSNAYANIQPKIPKTSLRESLKDLKKWHALLHNDFEQSLFNDTPALADIKSKLYDKGAFYASMSGSGSAVYGLFEKPVAVSDFKKHECILRSLALPPKSP
ncbi:MAG: 4-(cytidine 5'-diphospho)-2-C-methyl-D-erythritol kinase [Flammeovirgaceae bacterium]|nr:4-(cytidine 5'-diphospho)-2-C-methyl-D-erythritol kinase [Flammeovirgaceae bacterium]